MFIRKLSEKLFNLGVLELTNRNGKMETEMQID